MVWVIAFGELFFGDLWCVVWGYGGMRTHFSLLNPFFVFADSDKCYIRLITFDSGIGDVSLVSNLHALASMEL